MGTMRADFSYQQTSKITGGAMQGMMRVAGAFSRQAREPIVSTIMVRGHRMVHLNQHTGQIIDVDKETITDINFDKKTYSVMTFAQMKQMMDEMMQRAQQRGGQNPNDVQFKAAVKDTGQTKQIAGLDAKQMILTLTMEGTDQKTGNTGTMDITNDMWIAPVAGYEEVRNFQKLFAAKLGMAPGQNMGMFMQRPELIKGMADLYKEMAKLDGVPVETVTRIGGSGSGAPGSESTANQQPSSPPPTVGESAAGAALGRLGLGGFGRRKKNTEQQQTSQAPAGTGETQSAAGVLIEMTTDASGFSTAAVDGTKFEVPAGFKEVEPAMERRGR